MFLCVKRVNTLQLSSVKNKYCKVRIEAEVVVYMCSFNIYNCYRFLEVNGE